MNQTQHNWKIGMVLSLSVVLFWSTLPVALNISLQAIDAWTLTWVRFCVAAVITLLIIFYSGSYKGFLKLSVNNWLWLIFAAFMLTANYILFIIGLDKTTPGNAQVLIQLAPLLMILGGIVIYKESFKNSQKLGVLLLLVGMALFFNDQLGSVVKSQYRTGAIIMIFAAISWAVYALIQKKLHAVLSPQAILAMIYCLAALALIPTAHPSKLSELNNQQIWALTYACLNTVGAYGAFTQAIKYWQASRVGMVLALAPVFTFLFINAMSSAFPDLVQPEKIQNTGWIGVLLIVAGSMVASLGKK